MPHDMVDLDSTVMPNRATMKHTTTGGVEVTFQRLTVSVTKRGAAMPDTKSILKGISGSCKAGRLLAIMGASGAGKTTLVSMIGWNFNQCMFVLAPAVTCH